MNTQPDIRQGGFADQLPDYFEGRGDFCQASKERAYLLTPQELLNEKQLNLSAWYPYRLHDHVSKTQLFISAYDRTKFVLREHSHTLSQNHRENMKARGHYLKKATLSDPWFDPKKQTGNLSTDYKNFQKARRQADSLGAIYEDFINGAVLAGMKRGWPFGVLPKQMASDKLMDRVDKFHEATIPGYLERRYEQMPQLTDHEAFKADQHTGSAVQMAYIAHVARELARLNPLPESLAHLNLKNQAAERKWQLYQQEGSIPAHITYEQALTPK